MVVEAAEFGAPEPTRPPRQSYDLSVVRFLGISMRCGAPGTVARWMVDRAFNRAERTVVAHINANNYFWLCRRPGLLKSLTRAAILLPDGIGMKLAARADGHGELPNLNGTDLFPLVMEAGRQRGLRVFLLGGLEAVVQQARANTEASFPGVLVAGCRNGYFSLDEEGEVVSAINSCTPDLLLVGRGFPKQEEWTLRHQDLLKVPLIWNVGGLFDFISGAKPRAPRIVRIMNLEWLYRFLLNPSVMWHRNLVAMPWFIFRVCRSGLTRRVSRKQ